MTSKLRCVQILIKVVLACGILGYGANAQEANISLISVSSPEALRGNFTGVDATFSVPPPPGKYTAVAPVNDPEGCSEYTASSGLPSDRPAVAVIRRGTCTFAKKAKLAQKAGAEAILIVSDNEEFQIMGGSNSTAENSDIEILVVGVQKSLGDKILSRISAHNNSNNSEPVIMSFEHFSVKPDSILDVSEALLVCMATSLVIAGALLSTADLRQGGSPIVVAPEEVVEMDNSMSFGFCLLGSCALMLLFFFIQYLIYFIMFAFCIGGLSCMVQFGTAALHHFIPSLRQRMTPYVELPYASIISAVPALAIVVSWVLFRNTPYGWIFQDIIGACFLCSIQQTLRLPNIKIATLFLSIMFFFDIWWVFISPLVFQKSVMVTVATGGNTGESVPMLLRVPAMSDGHDRLLGFGDIALPGLLISFLRRHDILSKRKLVSGYFMPGVIGYFAGLCVTIGALMIMRMGQPALLYLVPGTLGTTLVLSWCRGDLKDLWAGNPSPVAGKSLTASGCGEDWL